MKFIRVIFILTAFTGHIMNAQIKPQKFKLALVQMSVIGGERAVNMRHAEEMLDEAAQNGAEVILLPEAMDLGWTDPSALTDALPIPAGESCQRLIQKAKQHRVYVCAGIIEQAGDKVYNSAVLIDPNGEVVLHHRKINELDIGHPYYALGGKLNVCETPFGTFGLLICADANTEHQVLTRSLAFMGADVILSPSSWAVPPDHDNEKDPYGGTWENAYVPVAKDFAVWIASTSNVGKMTDGPWKDWNGIGCSMVVNHKGEVVMQGPYGVEADTILYVEIDPVPRPAQGTNWPGYWKRE